MSEPECTPGPWEYHDDPNSVTIDIYPKKRPSLPIGTIYKTRGRPSKANAHMIAAAPDLYEALEEAVLQIEYLEDKFSHTGTGTSGLARIRAALAKARGEPH